MDAAGAFHSIEGARSIVWDSNQMATGSLDPVDKSTPLVVHCRSGKRAGRAAAFIQAKGFASVLNAGGPAGPHDLWAAMLKHAGVMREGGCGYRGSATESEGGCGAHLADSRGGWAGTRQQVFQEKPNVN